MKQNSFKSKQKTDNNIYNSPSLEKSNPKTVINYNQKKKIKIIKIK
jgi:hypothetical protein